MPRRARVRFLMIVQETFNADTYEHKQAFIIARVHTRWHACLGMLAYMFRHRYIHTHEREGCYAHKETSVLPQHARTCTCARCRWPYTGYTVNTQREYAARWQRTLPAGALALAPVLRWGRGGSDQTLGSIMYPPGPALLLPVRRSTSGEHVGCDPAELVAQDVVVAEAVETRARANRTR